MRRRDFFAAGTLAALSTTGFAHRNTVRRRIIKPTVLRNGDTVGLITPGFPAGGEHFQRAIDNIKSLGMVPKLGKNINGQYGYLAGTDAERAEDLMSMFRDPEVKAIWCVRGGYGCTRILPLLDYKTIRRNPKILIGYSDITALHLALFQKTGLVSFHGPVGTSELTDYTLENVKSMLLDQAGPERMIDLSSTNVETGKENSAYKYYVINPGRANGPLIGGNLSLITAMAGSEYLPSFKGKLVYLEDIGEKPYRIDRMLVQLLQATDIGEAAGIVLGIFEDCEPESEDTDFSIHQLFKDHLAPLNMPIAYGYSFGHIDDQCTFPVGIAAMMDTAARQIRVIEQPVLG